MKKFLEFLLIAILCEFIFVSFAMAANKQEKFEEDFSDCVERASDEIEEPESDSEKALWQKIFNNCMGELGYSEIKQNPGNNFDPSQLDEGGGVSYGDASG